MKKSRFTEAQIVGILKQHEVGTSTKDLCRQHGIIMTTFYKWKSKFGGMEVSDIAKIRALEDEPGDDQGVLASRVSTFMDRRAKLLSEIVPGRHSGLEIGPLASPIIAKSGGNRVLYVDHCQTRELIAKYDGQVPAEAIAEVDVVWSGGSLLEAVQGRMFDYVLASHVIEHVPDLILWLREIGSVLRPGGVLALAIPDKRYTFDITRPLSTVGEIIAAHLGRHIVPSVKQVYDNYTMARAVDADRVWDGSQRGETAPYLHSRGVADAFVKRVVAGEYVDCHCWIFTPRAFLDVLRALITEGYISFGVRRFFDSAAGQHEFIVTLVAHTPAADSFLIPNATGDTVDNGLL